MTQDSLPCLRIDFCLVHMPVAGQVTEVVEFEPLPKGRVFFEMSRDSSLWMVRTNAKNEMPFSYFVDGKES
jgi:hypothetical protein